MVRTKTIVSKTSGGTLFNESLASAPSALAFRKSCYINISDARGESRIEHWLLLNVVWCINSEAITTMTTT